jgi:hypothetical protein
MRKKDKMGVGLVFISDHGAGKSVISEMLATIIGERHSIVAGRPEDIVGKHNSQLNNKVLIVSEEVSYKNKEVANQLKTLVTAPKQTINEKFMPIYSVESHCNLMLNSNKGWVIDYQDTERRWVVYQVDNKYAGIQSPEAKRYFDTLRSIPPFVVAYYHYYLHDLPTDWNPRDLPAASAGTIDQKIKSLDSASRYLYSVLDECQDNYVWRSNFITLSIDSWYHGYVEWFAHHSNGRYKIDKIDYAKALPLRMGRGPRERKRNSDGRRYDIYRPCETLATARLAFAKSLGLPEFPFTIARDGDDDRFLVPEQHSLFD